MNQANHLSIINRINMIFININWIFRGFLQILPAINLIRLALRFSNQTLCFLSRGSWNRGLSWIYQLVICRIWSILWWVRICRLQFLQQHRMISQTSSRQGTIKTVINIKNQHCSPWITIPSNPFRIIIRIQRT